MYSWHSKLIKVLDKYPFPIFVFVRIRRLALIKMQGEFEVRIGLVESPQKGLYFDF